ncbi:hypothetical protein [Saliphagus sp. LR7]|uniref:hypothetical protein n=1 Tax=Saliphagus sp. LR7 TaxID=2282654 RepID=UPI000DF7A9D4|nr:hypothetical protein [Saliphagus sp. LR7]
MKEKVENLAELGETPRILGFAVAIALLAAITVDNDVLPAGSPPKVGLPARFLNACLVSRLQILMKSRKSTSTISVFLGLILADVTVYPDALPLFNTTTHTTFKAE